MYKNILCAVDISPESANILARASAIAEHYKARLSIAHVIEYSILPKDYQNKLKQEVIPKIEVLADKFAVPKKRLYVKFGQSYSNICDLADKQKIDLIILGSHGKHGIRAILGSTANGVLHHANCDTLLIRMH